MEANKVINDREYKIRPLSGSNESELQALCERCSDYWELHEGRMPKDAWNIILSDLPPDKSPEDKFLFGVYRENDVLIAVIDIMKDYKEPGEWMIGLLMIDPAERGTGLGRKLHDDIKVWVSEKRGKLLRIGVVEENLKGYRFWSKMGYIESHRVERTFGNKSHTIILMNLLLE